MKKPKISADEAGAELFALVENRATILEDYDYFISPDMEDVFVEPEVLYLIIFSIDIGIYVALGESIPGSEVRDAFFTEVMEYYSKTAYPEESIEELFERLESYVEMTSDAEPVEEMLTVLRVGLTEVCGYPEDDELGDFATSIFLTYIKEVNDCLNQYRIRG